MILAAHNIKRKSWTYLTSHDDGRSIDKERFKKPYYSANYFY